jgi:signal transduction histidine kinase
VRLIEAQLTIESNPGQGARLEVTIPQHRDGSNG